MATNPVLDKHERVAIIDQEVRRSERKEQINFRNRMTDIPVVRLDIGVPIYRIKNGRTRVEQYRYIKKHERDDHFFEGSEEDASVQSAQESILLRLSRDPKASIFDELAHVAVQTETLLLTSHGTVLNGNRRLAAMRQLFDDDPEKYARFSHVDVAVLPRQAAEKDLELLEAELQLVPETRLEYGWIERRLKLRHQVRDLKISRALIRSTYRFKREQDINIELSQLDLAEEYLADYLKTPLAYESVAQSEQLFKDLEESLRRRDQDRESEESRRTLGFLLAKEAGNLGRRVYRFREVFGKEFPKVAEKFSKREGIALSMIDQKVATSNPTTSPLDKLRPSGPRVATINYDEITKRLKDLSRSKNIGSIIADIAEEIRNEEKDESYGLIALKSAQTANAKLQEIDLKTADPSTLKEVAAQLETVISRANTLKVQVAKMVSSSEEPIQ